MEDDQENMEDKKKWNMNKKIQMEDDKKISKWQTKKNHNGRQPKQFKTEDKKKSI